MATRELIQVFIPEGDRTDKSIPVDLHDRWVIRLLATCSDLFGGATSYGRGVGVWDGVNGRCWDRVTVVEAWYDPNMPDLRARVCRLKRPLRAMGRALRQEAVAAMIENNFMVIEIGGQR